MLLVLIIIFISNIYMRMNITIFFMNFICKDIMD